MFMSIRIHTPIRNPKSVFSRMSQILEQCSTDSESIVAQARELALKIFQEHFFLSKRHIIYVIHFPKNSQAAREPSYVLYSIEHLESKIEKLSGARVPIDLFVSTLENRELVSHALSVCSNEFLERKLKFHNDYVFKNWLLDLILAMTVAIIVCLASVFVLFKLFFSNKNPPF